LHKFQAEVGGALAGGTAGVRLLEPASAPANTTRLQAPEAFKSRSNQWRLLPLYRIFGSDELSVHAAAIRELVEPPFIQLAADDAAALDVSDGDRMLVSLPDGGSSVAVQVNSQIPAGCAGFAVGLPDADWLPPDTYAELHKDPDQQKEKQGGEDV
ncbi:MAG: hypothetical protein KJP04_05040, partial [Arenicella sp.]|nr:hypothetical protein [Arenicella sp.]